jgi:hypothetical protein
MQRNLNSAVLAAIIAATTMAPAFARGNDLVIKDGFGEEVQIKNGFFGHKTKIVKDRLGNGFATKNGIFGSKEQDVNVLGNSFQRKKGIFGSSDVKGASIFGDKIETKKGFFGRRTTTIDASGISSVARTLWTKNKDSILGKSSAPVLPATQDLNNQDCAVPPAGSDIGTTGNTN